MESFIILTVWVAVVAGVDLAVIRPWRSAVARAPLPLALAFALAAWVLATGFMAYRQMMADGAWTGASIAMAFVPGKAILLSLLAYAAGRSFLSARGSQAAAVQRWALPALLSAAVVYSLVSDVTRIHAGALERHAANPALSAAETAVLVERVRTGDASRGEILAFLGNPKCPPDLLVAYAGASDVYFRTAVARNDLLDPAVADKLAGDQDEQVRLYLAFNRKLPPPILTRLAADSSEGVREGVTWTATLPDEAFARLVEDASPRVRATAARQSRLSAAQLEKLRNDPEQRVRDAAAWWGP